MKNQILTFIAVFAIFYLMWSFYYVSFDFDEWSKQGRYCYLLLSSMISSIVLISNKILKDFS